MNNILGNLIKEKLSEYPDLPSRTIARMIYGMNKDIFKNVDCVYYMVRYYRGRAGNKNRKIILGCYGKYF